MTAAAEARGVVLDTNVVLDLLVFRDPSTEALRAALAAGALRWLTRPVMREEFERVLGYPRIARWREAHAIDPRGLLQAFDAASRCCAAVATIQLRCADPDDQPFLDLAVAHGALLISRDRAVWELRRALGRLGVAVMQRFDGEKMTA